MNNAFIICNGPSREGFDLEKLKGKGKTFGCNAIYRDFQPNYIVAIDGRMIQLLDKSAYPKHRVLLPAEHERFESEEYRSIYHTPRYRSNTGMNAMYEAIKRNHKKLYILGMDFIVKDNANLALGNLYDGTEGYEMETRANAIDNENRVQYLNWFTGKHADVEFKFVLPRQELELHDVMGENVGGIFYDEFEKVLENG